MIRYDETMATSISPSLVFPPVEESDKDGLLALGGVLRPEWLLDAYSHGIFPWPMDDETPMAWWSPDPRGIFPLDQFHVSRRLRRTIRQERFEVTCDRAFRDVMVGCGSAAGRIANTWVTPAMVEAYVRLHRLGYAHSVETWRDGRLVGGTYGVSIAGLFAAESKFFRERDASKVALAYLVKHLERRGYSLLDIQMVTPHTARLGAMEISRAEYLRRLAAALGRAVSFGDRLSVGASDF
jgi:leucyl/phenylalanyl-tRNA--protein transferase